MLHTGKILANYKIILETADVVRKARINMSKRTYYAEKANEIIKNGGNSEDVIAYLEEVCKREKPASQAAFMAAIVLAL